MNNFEKLKAMSIEELAAWLDKNGIVDNSPWNEYFNDTYCNNCEVVMCKGEDAEEILGIKPFFLDDEIECGYCEVYGKCRYFEDMTKVPEGADVVKMWLEAEANE